MIRQGTNYTTNTIHSRTAEKQTAPQTIESFIRDHGGSIKWFKTYALCNGLSTKDFQTAMQLARTQGYKVKCYFNSINTFSYYKPSKEVK